MIFKKILKVNERKLVMQEKNFKCQSGWNKYNKFKDNKFSINIFKNLDENTKKKFSNLRHLIILFQLPQIFRYLSDIVNISLNYNIPRKKDNVRGSMLWHKDDLGYKSLDLFMAVSDIDDLNGPFHAVKDKNKLGVLSKFDADIKNLVRGERSKIKLDDFEKFKKEEDIISLKGKSGSTMFIDSFSCYHRGGHCIQNPRILLRISYQGVDSLF